MTTPADSANTPDSAPSAPSAPSWDPGQYLRFADERSRPFDELLARIERVAPEEPRLIVDLGAGPGTLTARLAERWPGARTVAVDSSPAMIERARTVDGIETELADLRDWESPQSVDLLLAHASLQWVPGHLALLERLVAMLAPGGTIALQVPGNFTEPSHTLLREIAARAPYAEATAEVARPASHDPVTYLRALQDLGCTADAWETTYLHVLSGPDPVFAWISGTGARPVLQALEPALRERFVADYKAALREAYPEDPRGVVLPFRRVFAVGRRP
ncbi:methyltransferase domain-containing protein [Brachybacterium sp. DNPG3]